MKYLAILVALTALTACQPRMINDAAGVTQRVNNEAMRASAIREAVLSGDQANVPAGSTRPAAPAPVGAVAVTPVFTPVQVPAPVGLDANPDNAAPAIVTQAQSGVQSAAQTATNASGISDEQNFDAVAGRESIESDAARLEANRQQYVLIEPKALPNRTSSGPNIVEFAIQTTNPVGVALYKRVTLFGTSRYARNCQKYLSSDLAQQDFLRKGGPKRDRMGIDPDGDGFACRWNPEPFRQAVQN